MARQHRNQQDWFIGQKIMLVRSISLPIGKHSQPVVVRIGRELFVLKKSSEGKGLSLQKTKKMVSALKTYHHQLKKSGISISELKMISAIPDTKNRGKHYVASLEEFIGRRNAGQVIETDKPRVAIRAFTKVMKEVYKAVKIASQRGKENAGVLIDSKPKNYVISDSGKVYFIDFYTPKLIDARGRLFPYFKELHERTRKELQTRFENKKAIFHVMLAESIALRPELRDRFEHLLISFLLSKKETEIVRYLRELIEHDYRKTTLVKESVLKRIPKIHSISQS